MGGLIFVDGPDFICIGMPKAGTGWLYDQLGHHPDFWMPPAKELNYLDREFPKLKNPLRRLENWENGVRRADRRGRAWGAPEREFLKDCAACAGEPMDVGRYASLFRHKGNLLSGDISPGYCALREEVIGGVVAKLPETKIILLVREPISRIWSRLCMNERKGKFDVSLLEDPAKFLEFIKKTRFIEERSFPTQIIRRWSVHYPIHTHLRVILFDDIARRPAEALRDILGFVGADTSRMGALPPDYNRKSGARKLEMPDAIKKVLVEYLGEEVRECAELLGGAARAWPSLIT